MRRSLISTEVPAESATQQLEPFRFGRKGHVEGLVVFKTTGNCLIVLKDIDDNDDNDVNRMISKRFVLETLLANTQPAGSVHKHQLDAKKKEEKKKIHPGKTVKNNSCNPPPPHQKKQKNLLCTQFRQIS